MAAHHPKSKGQKLKLISFLSFKGGAGKTTCLMAVASDLVSRGEKIALFEADENAPLSQWRDYALEGDTWSGKCCSLWVTDTVSDLESAYTEAEQAGCGYALVDTAGGGSDLNTTIMLSSQLTVIPTGLTTMDLDAALDPLSFATAAGKTAEVDVQAKLLLTRMPTKRLSSEQRKNLEAITSLPQFSSRLPDRSVLGGIKSTGMLGNYQKRVMDTPSQRIMSGHLKTAIAEVRMLTDEILSIV